MRVTRRGLAMPQLRGGNGRSQEYLAFLLPLLHNGGRTPRPQTRSEQFTFTVNDNFNLKYFKYYCCCCCGGESSFQGVCFPRSRVFRSPVLQFRLRPSEPKILTLRTWRRRHEIDVNEKEKYFARDLKSTLGVLATEGIF